MWYCWPQRVLVKGCGYLSSKKYLPHIFSEDFSNLAIFSHTDLQRDGFKERFDRISEIADAVVIDEAHHFRNRGQTAMWRHWEKRSRYWRLFDTMGGTRNKPSC